MNDVKQFLRYVTPGLVFLTESIVLYILSDPMNALDNIKSFLTYDGKSNGLIGLSIVAVVISGGLGYLFSTLHHMLYWHVYPRRLPTIVADHRAILTSMESRYFIALNLQGGDNISAEDLSIEGAWRVVASLWNARIKANRHSVAIKSANDRVQSLADLMHGSGTALIACCSAILLCLCIMVGREFFSLLHSWEYLLIWGINTLLFSFYLVVLHYRNYKMIVQHTLSVSEITLWEALRREVSEAKIEITVAVRDLGRDKRQHLGGLTS